MLSKAHSSQKLDMEKKNLKSFIQEEFISDK